METWKIEENLSLGFGRRVGDGIRGFGSSVGGGGEGGGTVKNGG